MHIKEQLRQYTYYIIIAAISLVTIIVFPLIGSGSSVTIEQAFPTTTIGWIIYCTERALVIAMNLTIFTAFIQQAKINIADDPNYKLANSILQKHKPKEYKPRSEKAYLSQVYSKKGLTLTLSTVASLFVIGSAIFNYDYMLLIAVTFSVITTIVMGILQMRKTEIYYTTEYLDNAQLLSQADEHNIQKEEQNDNNKQHTIPQPTGTSTQESTGH